MTVFFDCSDKDERMFIFQIISFKSYYNIRKSIHIGYVTNKKVLI